ncbi:hypothetical protein V8F20_004258 [Naviculisporaceae sp. PSN 640]
MKYYWIDPSCDGIYGLEFDTYVQEARALALRAAQRLANPTDTDFARVYNILFKMPKTATTEYPLPDRWFMLNCLSAIHPNLRHKNTVFNHVLSALVDFATDWEKTDIRERAHVRIYNNSAWRVKFNHQDPKGHDPVNSISFVTNEAVLKASSSALLFANHNQLGGPKGLETLRRCTLDLYMKAWVAPACNYHLSMKSLNDWVVSTSAKQIDVLGCAKYMMTNIVAHEFMHTHTYGFDDGPHEGTNKRTAGWDYVMQAKKEHAWQSADAMALLMFAAGVADMRPEGKSKGGFTLPRYWDSIPGSHEPVEGEKNQKWDPQYPFNSALKGKFHFYDDLTD